ncbi:Uncharacterised protein [Mycobacteroides abscessus subsp. massiliense]|nr:Uncharacterised protein [Mycobacteroides abscessus subsp. massiliense]
MRICHPRLLIHIDESCVSLTKITKYLTLLMTYLLVKLL